ncbi:MAG: O-antigen ligase domain-containing protein [Planctomycetota bacterium]|nr:MAG: O-antigen ligase domain-containing protein [Planctomycetota bacterium]
MYSPSITTSTGFLTPEAERDSAASANLLFVGAAVALISLAYILPLGPAWARSTQEHFLVAELMESGAEQGTLGRQFGLGALGLFGLLALAWPDGKSLRTRGALGVLCLAFVAWCGLSLLWAIDKSGSFRRFVALGCEATAALAIARRASMRQLVWIVFACSAIWLGLGILAEVSHGTFRPWQTGYRFAGLFHPNESASASSVLALSSLYLATRGEQRKRWLWAVAIVAAGFVVLSGSRTALFAMLLAAVLVWAMQMRFGRLVVWGMAASWLAIIAALVMGSWLMETGSGAISLGRVDQENSTLTGRIPLWQELMEQVGKRPLTGYGYNAFWTVDNIRSISDSQGWDLSAAHSAYIDLVLSVGLIGAVLCLVPMFLGVARSMQFERRAPGLGYGFTAMLLLLALLCGLTETTIGATWFLALFGMCGLAHVAFEVREIVPQQGPRSERTTLEPPRLKRIETSS